MKKDMWLVIANSAIARVFKVDNKHSLTEIETFIHPESRLHNRDLVSDRPGRSFESMGPARHGVDTGISPKQQECTFFAKEIANYLDTARSKGVFERLYLIASPNVLGLLRQNLDPMTMKLLAGELDKDITHLKIHEIPSHLPFFH